MVQTWLSCLPLSSCETLSSYRTVSQFPRLLNKLPIGLNCRVKNNTVSVVHGREHAQCILCCLLLLCIPKAGAIAECQIGEETHTCSGLDKKLYVGQTHLTKISYCVCVHKRMREYVGSCVPWSLCVRRLEDPFRSVFFHSVFLRQAFLVGSETVLQASWPGSFQAILLFLPPVWYRSSVITDALLTAAFKTVGSGYQTSGFQQQAPTPTDSSAGLASRHL